MNKIQFVNELAKLRPASTFLSVLGYRNAFSEVSNYNIIFHMSYESALKRSIKILQDTVTDNDMQAQAKQELLTSFNQSLLKVKTPIEEIDDAYTRFFDTDGKYIKGVKMHTETGALHLYGLIVNKRILMPGMYPVDTRKTLTVIKDKLRESTPVGKFRQFKILPTQVDLISVENLKLLPPE